MFQFIKAGGVVQRAFAKPKRHDHTIIRTRPFGRCAERAVPADLGDERVHHLPHPVLVRNRFLTSFYLGEIFRRVIKKGEGVGHIRHHPPLFDVAQLERYITAGAVIGVKLKEQRIAVDFL